MHEVIARYMSEQEFRELIMDGAQRLGYLVLYIRDSRLCTESGWPDLVIMHPVKHKLHVWELKKQGGRVKPKQWVWIRGLQACGIDAGVKYPKDIDDMLRTLAA